MTGPLGAAAISLNRGHLSVASVLDALSEVNYPVGGCFVPRSRELSKNTFPSWADWSCLWGGAEVLPRTTFPSSPCPHGHVTVSHQWNVSTFYGEGCPFSAWLLWNPSALSALCPLCPLPTQLKAGTPRPWRVVASPRTPGTKLPWHCPLGTHLSQHLMLSGRCGARVFGDWAPAACPLCPRGSPVAQTIGHSGVPER